MLWSCMKSKIMEFAGRVYLHILKFVWHLRRKEKILDDLLFSAQIQNVCECVTVHVPAWERALDFIHWSLFIHHFCIDYTLYIVFLSTLPMYCCLCCINSFFIYMYFVFGQDTKIFHSFRYTSLHRCWIL